MALQDEGIRIGTDIQVITHCNWPRSEKSLMPIHRIGYHIHDILHACMDNIALLRNGERPPTITLIEPFFEEELAGMHKPIQHAGIVGE